MDGHSFIYISLTSFPILTTLISTLIFGEEVVIILGFLAGLNYLPIWILFVFGLFGTLLSDLIWFTVGKKLFKENKSKNKIHKKYHKFNQYLGKFSKGNDFLTLLITRFFFVFRIFALVHVGSKGMKFKKFIAYEIPLILIWLSIFVPIGWFFGNVALYYLGAFQDFQIVIFGVLFFFVTFNIFKEIISQIIKFLTS